MSKYIMLFVVFILAIFFTACGDENEKSQIEVEIEELPVNKQAIMFPYLPSKNIDTSTLE